MNNSNFEGGSSQEHIEKYSVVLPCDPKMFNEFISGLLGKPQTISKRFRGAFEINQQEIINIYHLVSQRVYQQNKASLIQFNVKIVFDDNSSVLLNSIEDFSSYSEIRPVASTQVHLSWSFLVQFQDKKAPEKQEIEISFITESGRGIPIYEDDSPMIFSISRAVNQGYVVFRIKHTARTWGADIESLLSGHIKNILHPPSQIRELAWRHSSKIGSGVGASFFVSALIVCFITASNIWNDQQLAVGGFIASTKNTNEKLDFILNLICSGLWSRFFFSVIVFLIVSLVIAIILGTWAENSADTNKPSFILLTKKAEREKERLLIKYNKKWSSFIFSIITSVITGIIANIVFTISWK